ncbi:MAG: hypothetical protein HOP17_12965 [Acidobacteria bacterium]|nr:hypothetical protein [Acidobacteriota bacterium]
MLKQLHLRSSSIQLYLAIFLLFQLVGRAEISGQTPASAMIPAAPESSQATVKKDNPVKITFDEKDPTIMFVESNGERFRVNSSTKQVERISFSEDAETTTAAAPLSPPGAPANPAVQEEKEDYYAYESGEEPFDYRLINVPTPKKVPKGTWNISFTHRFSQPIQPFKESAPRLLGFDSFSTSSFGVSYGITDKLYINAYRSPLCQNGLCRTIEVGLGYHLTDQDKKSPLAISTYASVEGNNNFTEEYTYNLQAMFSRRFGKRVFLFFSPAIHLNSNGQHRFNPRAEDYYPPATDAVSAFKLPTHGASFGMGASVRITPSVMGIFEFTPRTGFKLGQTDPIFDNDFNVTGFNHLSQPEMGIGVQYSIGNHSFTLTLSNTQTTTTSRYNSSNLVLSPRHLIIGFNLFRRW